MFYGSFDFVQPFEKCKSIFKIYLFLVKTVFSFWTIPKQVVNRMLLWAVVGQPLAIRTMLGEAGQ